MPATDRVFAPRDAAALMRFSLLPTDAAAADPIKNAAISRLGQALTGQTARAAVSAAGLRGPTWPAAPPPAATEAGLLQFRRQRCPTMIEHLMYHVLSTRRPELRRTNMLIVVDVSGSMGEVLAGTGSTKIDLVRQGIKQVNALLPSAAQLGLWQFGSRLAPPDDSATAYRRRTAERAAAEGGGHRCDEPGRAAGWYRAVRHHFGCLPIPAGALCSWPAEPGDPVHGRRNEDDPATITIDQLKAGLAAAGAQKYVQISVFGFGPSIPADAVRSALSPVDGQVDELTNNDQVIGAFVHAVSGALSGSPGRLSRVLGSVGAVSQTAARSRVAPAAPMV